nr:immunoglobulin light chain junction region [Macaca mulatta]
CQHYYSTSYSF